MFESVKSFFDIGGVVMYCIFVCSVTALAIFLERLWTLRRNKVIPRALYIDIEASLENGQIDQAMTLCRKDNSPLAKIFYQGLTQARLGVAAVKEVIDEETERQSFALERGVGVLGMITTLAPLLGFLGTVLGMVQLFTSIAAQGEIQNIGVIAGGVYKALYTTVAGLIVAIPTTLFHKYCLSNVDQRLLTMEELSLKLLGLLGDSREAIKVS